MNEPESSYFFTVPATSCFLVAAASDVAAVTTAAPTEAAAGVHGPMAYNTSSPFRLLLYASTQSQKLFGAGAQGGLLFSGPARDYLILTVFTVGFPVPSIGV